MVDTSKTREFHYKFVGSYPCPEKAKAMRQGRYAHVARRNDREISVRVTVPEVVLEFSQIEMPERRREHVGRLQILMDAAIPDSAVQVELTREDLRKLDILKVTYDREQVPDKCVINISLPLERAVVEMLIYSSDDHMGTDCTQAAVCVVVNNVMGVQAPFQNTNRQRRGRQTGRERPLNYQLHQINEFWFNYWVNRDKDPDDAKEAGEEVTKYTDMYFWPAKCQLHVQVGNEMLYRPEDLVQDDEGTLSYKHRALMGAHPNLLQSIWDGSLAVYIVPEIVAQVHGKGQRDLFTYKFPELIAALDNNKVSSMLQGSQHFLPRAEMSYDFYCCNGLNDPNNNQVFMTSACFGRAQPIYHMQWRDGRREAVVRDGEKVLNKQVGHLVVLSELTAHQMAGAVYEAMVDGEMDRFYEKHGLIIPEEAFAGDDEEARRLYKAKKQAEREQGSETEEGEEDSEPKPEEEPFSPLPDPEKKPVEFGSFLDVLPPDPEEEVANGSDADDSDCEAEAEDNSAEDSDDETEAEDDSAENPADNDAEDSDDDSADPVNFPV